MATTLSVADLIDQEGPRLWLGPSGEGVTGEAVAHFLQATTDLLDRDGWVRIMADVSPAEPAPRDSATVPEMLGWLVRQVREELSATSAPHTLGEAISRVAYSEHGDDDTRAAATRLIELVLRERTGASHLSYTSWAGKLGRTDAEVHEVLTDAITAAHQHGPTA